MTTKAKALVEKLVSLTGPVLESDQFVNVTDGTPVGRGANLYLVHVPEIDGDWSLGANVVRGDNVEHAISQLLADIGKDAAESDVFDDARITRLNV